MGRPLALITGASSGIGRAVAAELARRGHDLALTGRDAAALEETAAACRALGAGVRVLPADLAAPGAAARLLAALGEPVEVLVSNAGFGVHGDFAGTDPAREREMLAVHVAAPLELVKGALPGMIARGRGRLLLVSSVYAFAPVPGQAVYAATKSFQASFADSLAGELEGTGVTVTTLCPGVTRTGFRPRAGMNEGRLPGMSAEAVAAAAVAGLLAGRRLVVPGLANRLFVGLARLVGGHRLPGLMRRLNRLRGLGPAV